MTPAAKNPKVISMLVFVFLAGAASGALSMRLGLHEKLHRTVTAAASRVPAAPARDALLQRFNRELNLTGEQSTQIAVVLDEYRQYYQSLQDEIDDIRATGRSRIVQILEPAQREKFEKMMTELQPRLEGK